MVMTGVRTPIKRADPVRVAGVAVRAQAVGWGWPIWLMLIRLLVIAGGMGITFGVASILHARDALLLSLTAALPMTLVANLVSLEILVWRGHKEGFRLRDLIGFRGGLVPSLKEAGWSLLWVPALLVPFWLAATGVLAALVHSKDLSTLPHVLSNLLVGPVGLAAGKTFPLWYGILIAVLFPLVNPLLEEMHYRGYVQPRLAARSKHAWLAIGITGIVFGAQYGAYAWAWGSVPIFIAGYVVWGLLAGVISHLQRRIVPLLLAHFIVSIPVAILPLAYILLAHFSLIPK
jgi:membrane protease YdiL (CAAX protease family)